MILCLRLYKYLQIGLFINILGIAKDSKLGSALNFFVFDTIKIFILLLIIIYAITFIRSFFPPEKTRKILAKNKGSAFIGHVLAALLGIVTPFCSCSAVPLFIGFVEAGVPLGVTFSYLIAAPMVNEVALGLLYGLFGWKIALIYVASGEIIAIVSGMILGKMKLEKYVEGYVYEMKVNADLELPESNNERKTNRFLELYKRFDKENMDICNNRYCYRWSNAWLDSSRSTCKVCW